MDFGLNSITILTSTAVYNIMGDKLVECTFSNTQGRRIINLTKFLMTTELQVFVLVRVTVGIRASLVRITPYWNKYMYSYQCECSLSLELDNRQIYDDPVKWRQLRRQTENCCARLAFDQPRRRNNADRPTRSYTIHNY